MNKVISPRGRFGWNERETQVLWEEVRGCNQGGEPLRAAFDRIALRTGRKANSIRNHYYATIKSENAPEDLCIKRAAPFVPFDEGEVESLLRSVLVAQGSGRSVRACVMELAGGDKTMALRLQNKYRSLLKNHPERILKTVDELKASGLPAVDPYRKQRSLPRRSQRGQAADTKLLKSLRQADADTAIKILCAIADVLEQE